MLNTPDLEIAKQVTTEGSSEASRELERESLATPGAFAETAAVR